MLGPFLGVHNFEFRSISFFFFFFFFFLGGGGGGGQKNEYFWGMKILWIFLWVLAKLDYFWWSFLCRSSARCINIDSDFRVFSYGQGPNENIFGGLLKFLFFLYFLGGGMSGIPDIFSVNSRCWVKAY